jgi:alpha,alpha-trehalase
MILADYRMQKSQTSFDLRHFVELNFTLPRENDQYVPPKDKRCASISTDYGPY